MSDQEFATFVRVHAQALRLTAFHLTAEPAAAEDLLYAALAVTRLRWDRIDHDLPAVRTILVRTATDPQRPLPWRPVPWPLWSWRPSSWRSWQYRRDDVPELFEERPPGEPALVLGAVQELSPRHRATIAVRVLEALPADEAARVLGRPAGAVESELKTALRMVGLLVHEIGTPVRLDPHDLERGPAASRVEAIAERVRDAFADGAAPQRGNPGDLGSQAIIRARQVRWQRRTAALAAVVAVAVAAIVLPGMLSGDVQPAAGETAGDTAGDTAGGIPGGGVFRGQDQGEGRRRGRSGEAPQTVPAPLGGDLPLGVAPGVPYAVNAYEFGGGFLYDGAVQVPIPGGARLLPFGRVNGGWLVVRGDAHDYIDGRPRHGRVGIQHGDGGFVPYGIAAEWRAALSPDGRQAAFITPGLGGSSLVVIDFATGRRTVHEPAEGLLGWNPEGIWYHTRSTFVWRPGTAPRPVRGAGLIDVHRTSSWITERTDGCVAVATLRRDGSLARQPRQCGVGVLTPAGRYVQLPVRTIEAGPGADTARLRLVYALSDVTWEDATHALLHVSSGDASGTREIVVRCDVAGPRCERAYDETFRGGAAQRVMLSGP